MVREFREFLLKQNALALAVGVITGAALGRVVTSLVSDLLMPLISLGMPAGDWRAAKIVLSQGVGPDGKAVVDALNYRAFIGTGVGVVVGDQLVFAKGYGYRDYEKKLPFTPGTVCPIASNTKLFTAIAAGMLVEEGKLTWDRPVRESVPTIRFHNEQLNNTVTLRDMLSHRTGITRHDTIWYKSDFTRKELFDRLKYLEPQEPMRQSFLYNNLMFAGVGYMIELQSGRTWEQFVRERILQPLDMKSTGYTIAEMVKAPEHGVGFTEKRDSFDLYKIPYYEDIEGVAPCGAIVSNIQDLSHWLVALMNNGLYGGTQVIPADLLKQTLQPAIGLPNTAAEQPRDLEMLNAAYGLGRQTASYPGHLITYHGRDLP